jgi:hypothetical protein
MKLRIAMDDKKMDVRLRDRFITENIVSKSDIETYLSALPDDEGNYEVVEDKKESQNESEITE